VLIRNNIKTRLSFAESDSSTNVNGDLTSASQHRARKTEQQSEDDHATYCHADYVSRCRRSKYTQPQKEQCHHHWRHSQCLFGPATISGKPTSLHSKSIFSIAGCTSLRIAHLYFPFSTETERNNFLLLKISHCPSICDNFRYLRRGHYRWYLCSIYRRTRCPLPWTPRRSLSSCNP